MTAVEEERLNRIKHPIHFPGNAISSCVKMGGINSEDLDYVADCRFSGKCFENSSTFHIRKTGLF